VPDVSLAQVALLALAALGAGVVDAIAGGGGLVTLPALLAAGLPPQLALGTNKGQSVFGSGTALVRFSRAGLVDPARAKLAFPAGLLGSALGALALTAMSPRHLKPIVLVLLVGAAIVVGLRSGPPRVTARVPPRYTSLATVGIALVIAAYDGFFGPGTGTFLIVAFASLLGDPLRKASGEAKVVNFASNLAALAILASRGLVAWKIALPMAAAQAAGGFAGAHLAIKGGDVVVRRVVLLVVLALVVKLGRDLWTG
jgi:uncharacterized membrane protein YfcA